MKKIIILIPFLLGGCLEQAWIKDGATPQQANMAYKICQKKSTQQTTLPPSQYTNKCMTANGWIKVEEALEGN